MIVVADPRIALIKHATRVRYRRIVKLVCSCCSSTNGVLNHGDFYKRFSLRYPCNRGSDNHQLCGFRYGTIGFRLVMSDESRD